MHRVYLKLALDRCSFAFQCLRCAVVLVVDWQIESQRSCERLLCSRKCCDLPKAVIADNAVSIKTNTIAQNNYEPTCITLS